MASVVVIDNRLKVAPPTGSVPATTLPLTFFDVPFVSCCPPVEKILFYESPHSTIDFIQSVLPRLNQSLSLTLRHFFPFAAHLACPPPPHDDPFIIYKEGDSVQVTIAESGDDFNHLVSNHARDVKAIRSLVPKLSPSRLSSSKVTHVVPVMAMQFTVFPNSGFSIGVTSNHAAADGRSVNHFMKFWASVNRSQGDHDHQDSDTLPLPYCKRDIIKDPGRLSSSLLKELRTWDDPVDPVGDRVPPDNVLVTLVINRLKIEKLKHWVANQITNDGLGQVRISTFAVVCGFMWVNLMKLQEQIRGNTDDDNMLYHFLFGADCRERFEFPIPQTYFGNCLTHYLVSATRGELMGESGIAVAAKAIGSEISKLQKGAVIETGKWLSDLKEILKDGRLVTVSSSPKLRVYETDFGWGRPKKFEIVHFGAYEIFSIVESKEDDDGGLDIGLVVGRDKLDLFNVVFDF